MKTAPLRLSYLANPDVCCSYADASIVILQVPYEGTVSYGRGTAKGPAAIIAASAQLELYDIPTGTQPWKLGIATLPPMKLPADPALIAPKVHAQTRQVLRDGKRPVVFGGEHSISLGAVQAVREAFPGVGVLHFDAHSDLRDTYTGTRHSHGCIMKRIFDLGVPHAAVGIRSMSAGEADFIRKERIPVYGPEAAVRKRRQIIGALPDDVYVSFDVDAFDPAVMPATGTPEPGGFNWFEVECILAELVRQGKRLRGFDIVELAPVPGLHLCEFTAAKLAYRMMSMFGSPKRQSARKS